MTTIKNAKEKAAAKERMQKLSRETLLLAHSHDIAVSEIIISMASVIRALLESAKKRGAPAASVIKLEDEIERLIFSKEL